MIIFVTGTGTDVGKTIVSALLTSGFSNLFSKVAYYKPVQTGPENQDATTVKNLTTCKVFPSSYNYPLAASPDQAYEDCKNTKIGADEVCFDRISANLLELKQSHDILIVEGAGGLFVPVNKKGETWFDLLSRPDCIDMRIVVVADSQLGTINHSSLTIEALTNRGLSPEVVILSGERHLANEKSLSNLHSNTEFVHCDKINTENKESFEAHAEALTTRVFDNIEKNNLKRLQKTQQTLSDDNKYCWHPFTQHKTALTPINIIGARGSYLFTADGKKLFDGISSWWVNTVGHGRLEIGSEILKQQQTLDHVLFAGTTHSAASTLSKTLVEMAGDHFSKVFFSDNGSTSIEVGLKMAYQYMKNKGKNPRKFLALKGSYHGDTFGAMSVGAQTGFHDTYEKLFFDVDFIEPLTCHPSPYFDGTSESRELKFANLQQIFQGDKEYAGLIIEPLIQGAGGMLVQDSAWASELMNLAKANSIPIIVDEVFTGLGRIGEHFAFQRLGVTPDIICTSKGLTGGNLSVAVTIASEDIYNSFLSDKKSEAFLHGHSYTANPIACSAANAALKITKDEKFRDRAKKLEEIFNSWILQSSKLPIENARALGGILAFELKSSGKADYFSNAAAELQQKAFDKGLLIRPLGNTVYLAVPLVVSEQEISSALNTLSECLI